MPQPERKTRESINRLLRARVHDSTDGGVRIASGTAIAVVDPGEVNITAFRGTSIRDLPLDSTTNLTTEGHFKTLHRQYGPGEL
jgi:hypothetical protein